MEKNNILYESQIEKWDESTDVIVIGSGFAGLAAAIEARGKGVSVLVLEKMKAVGGNSVISDGGIAAPGVALQKKYGVEDSADLMYQDMMEAGLGLNNPKLVRTLVDHAKECYEWSEDYLGVDYLDRIDIFGGHSVLRCYTALDITGRTIIKQQMNKLDELESEVRLSTYVEKLIVNDANEVCGLLVKENYQYKQPDSGVLKKIKANKGIVLATGGFGADVEFRSKLDPRLNKEIDTTNKSYSTAEVIEEAINIGADTVDMKEIQLGPWGCPDEKGYGLGPMFSEYIVFQYGMLVNPQTGKRFINELSDRKTLSDKLLEIGHPCIGIADDQAVKIAGWNIDKGIERGIVKKYDSVEELAEAYSISINELKESIDLFNENFEHRVDESFDKPILDDAVPITKAPYYAMRLWPKVHFTMGGLKINEKAEVIDTDGKIIKGLYAAGEVTGGVHGASRLGSCSITDCFVIGRIAGENAASNSIA